MCMTVPRLKHFSYVATLNVCDISFKMEISLIYNKMNSAYLLSLMNFDTVTAIQNIYDIIKLSQNLQIFPSMSLLISRGMKSVVDIALSSNLNSS